MANQNDRFIDEVTEDLRRDRLFLMLRRYGWIAVLLILALVAGAAWREYASSRDRAAARAFGDAILAAEAETDAAARADALAAVAGRPGRTDRRRTGERRGGRTRCDAGSGAEGRRAVGGHGAHAGRGGQTGQALGRDARGDPVDQVPGGQQVEDDPVEVGQPVGGELTVHQLPGRRRAAEELLDVLPRDLGELGPALERDQGALVPHRPQQPAAQRARAGSGLDVRQRVAVGVLDHQVRVERGVGGLAERLDHGRTEGQVRHEMVVHDVDVQPVGAVHRGGLVGQSGEVGRQDRRGDQRGWTCFWHGTHDRQRTCRAAANMASVPCRCGQS